MFCVRAQYLLVRSSMVRGMVNMHKSRSEIARLAMKIFLVVSNTFNKINCILVYTYQISNCLLLLQYHDCHNPNKNATQPHALTAVGLDTKMTVGPKPNRPREQTRGDHP